MRQGVQAIVATTIAIALFGPRLHAQSFLDPPQASQSMSVDARAEAMGGAFTALAEGALATYWNPGGLAQRRSRAALTPFSVRDFPREDASMYAAGSILATQRLALGLYYSRLSFEQLAPTSIASSLYGVGKHRQHNVHVGLGMDLLSLIGSVGPNWYLGVGGSMKYSEGIGRDTGAVGLDVGALGSLRVPVGEAGDGAGAVGLRIGVSARNLVGTAIGPSPRIVGPFILSEVQPPASMRYGVAGRVEMPHAFRGPKASLTVSGELEQVRSDDNEPSVARFGVECAFFGVAAFQFGYVNEAQAGWTRGLSLGGPETWMQLHYARTRVGSAYSNHYTVSGSWSF